MKENYTYEVCPICDKEVRLEAEMKIQECPECGAQILPCSLCDPDTCDCKNCDLENRLMELRKADEVSCSVCGKVCHYDTDGGVWIGTEFVCEDCHNQFPSEIKGSLEGVNYEYAPNDVVDYINNAMKGDWVYID